MQEYGTWFTTIKKERKFSVKLVIDKNIRCSIFTECIWIQTRTFIIDEIYATILYAGPSRQRQFRPLFEALKHFNLIPLFHHHHHVVPLARISLTLSRHFSVSFIASGRSSGLHPVSSPSCCMYVRAGRPAFAWPYPGVHRSTSLMSSSLLLQQ